MLFPQAVAVQLLSQPSSSSRFPSSQASRPSKVPSPHVLSKTQFSSQPSLFVVLPSSHCSPDVTMLFPHAVFVQLLSQPSSFVEFPSSHSSPNPDCVTLSPQISFSQTSLHPSSLIRFPSSQDSAPETSVPSPQAFSIEPTSHRFNRVWPTWSFAVQFVSPASMAGLVSRRGKKA